MPALSYCFIYIFSYLYYYVSPIYLFVCLFDWWEERAFHVNHVSAFLRLNISIVYALLFIANRLLSHDLFTSPRLHCSGRS